MPRVVKIIGSVGEKIVKTVTIIPEKKYPLKITDVTAKKGKDIKFNLTQIKEPDKKGYLLTVENLKKDHPIFAKISRDEKIKIKDGIEIMK